MSSTSTIATPGVSDGGTLWRGFILLPLGLLLYAVLPAGVLKTIVGIVMLIFDIGMMLVGVGSYGRLDAWAALAAAVWGHSPGHHRDRRHEYRQRPAHAAIHG